jgi:hypothetical protein
MANPRPDGPLRVLSAIGGALGVLPLLDSARDLATTLFSIPELPGAERLLRDVKQATYFEVALLLIVAPAASIFFGRVLPGALEARGVSPRRASFAGVGFGSSLLLWRAGASDKVSVICGLALGAAIVLAPRLRRSRVVVPIALLAVFVAGLVAFYRPAQRLDLFEDGLILFGASSLANGARPYLDVYPIHGWGADGGLDAILFRYAEHDLHAFRVLRAVMTALALASVAAAAILFFGDVGWGALGFLGCLAFCPFVSERHVPAMLAYCLLIQASRSGGTGRWLWAGIASGVTLFITLDFGTILLIGGSIAPIALVLVERKPLRAAASGTVGFGAGFLLGCVPFVAILAVRGAFPEFLRVSFIEIPRSITPVWGFPMGPFNEAVREGRFGDCFNPFGKWDAPSLCVLLLVLIATGIVILYRWADRRVEPTDRAAAVCLLVALLALRGVLGRADLGHRMIYGIFAGLPAAWLVYRAWNTSSRFRTLVTALTATAFFLFLRPDRAASREITAVSAAAYARRVDARAATRVSGFGPAMVARDQAIDVGRLRRFIDDVVPAGKTFFEFGNEPGLYFLVNRRPAVRYSCVPSYETIEKQREVIAVLERDRPPVAILSSGTDSDIFDSVSNRDRAPLVARFLDTHYRVVGKVGRRTVGVWKNP